MKSFDFILSFLIDTYNDKCLCYKRLINVFIQTVPYKFTDFLLGFAFILVKNHDL